MNIFILDKDPEISAQMMCDKHIPKMIVESAQMLSTAHRMLDGEKTTRRSKSGKRMVPYYDLSDIDYEAELIYMKAVHFGHPCTKWTMESSANYEWHWEHLYALCKEYTYRYATEKEPYKNTKVERERLWYLKSLPTNIPKAEMTPFAQAMNHYPMCKHMDPIQAYRNYYHAAKPFAKWQKGRVAPYWWEGFKGADVYAAK